MGSMESGSGPNVISSSALESETMWSGRKESSVSGGNSPKNPTSDSLETFGSVGAPEALVVMPFEVFSRAKAGGHGASEGRWNIFWKHERKLDAFVFLDGFGLGFSNDR